MTRALQALAELEAAGQAITVTAVAARAGISRAWLYTQAGLRDQISAQRVAAPARPARAVPASEASLRQRLTLAHQRIRELNASNQQLRDQIAALHGKLRAARLTNSPVTDTVNNADAQATQPNGQNDRR